MSSTSIPFGLKGNEMVSVDQVPQGLKCDCVCPECGGKLLARRCHNKVDHFAHYKLTDCKSALETSLHKMAKQILSNSTDFRIPDLTIKHPGNGKVYKVKESADIQIDEVLVERRLGDIQPDLILSSGEQRLFIEIYVTHKVSADKIDKVKNLGDACIEIDCRDWREMTNIEDFERFLKYGTVKKTWVYNQLAQKKLEELIRLEKERLDRVQKMKLKVQAREPRRYEVATTKTSNEEIALDDPRIQQYAVFPTTPQKMNTKMQRTMQGLDPVPCMYCRSETAKWSKFDPKSWTCVCRKCIYKVKADF